MTCSTVLTRGAPPPAGSSWGGGVKSRPGLLSARAHTLEGSKYRGVLLLLLLLPSVGAPPAAALAKALPGQEALKLCTCAGEVALLPLPVPLAAPQSCMLLTSTALPGRPVKLVREVRTLSARGCHRLKGREAGK